MANATLKKKVREQKLHSLKLWSNQGRAVLLKIQTNIDQRDGTDHPEGDPDRHSQLISDQGMQTMEKAPPFQQMLEEQVSVCANPWISTVT